MIAGSSERRRDGNGIRSPRRSHDLSRSLTEHLPTSSREKLMLLSRGKSPTSLVLFPSLSRPAGLRHVHGEAREISSLPGTACLPFLHAVEIDLLQDRGAATARSSCVRASAYVKANLHASPLIMNRMYRPRGRGVEWASSFFKLCTSIPNRI